MRLFYALWPDTAVQRSLAAWGRDCHRVCGGRVVAAEMLHVTVAFLGEVADDGYATLLEIGGSLGSAGFELVFDRVAFWRHSGIVYASPSRIPEPLAALALVLSERLAGAGLRIEERPFAPHVTLLRNARRSPRDIGFAPVIWQAQALSLIETLRQDGKHAYRVRESWTLFR